MFRPTAEIARLESCNQMSKQCVFEALPAVRRIHGRWLVRKERSENGGHGCRRLTRHPMLNKAPIIGA